MYSWACSTPLRTAVWYLFADSSSTDPRTSELLPITSPEKVIFLYHEFFNASQQQPRRMWQTFDRLVRPGHAPSTEVAFPTAAILSLKYLCKTDASVLHKYSNDKIAAVRNATSSAAEPTIQTGSELRLFTLVSQADVRLCVASIRYWPLLCELAVHLSPSKISQSILTSTSQCALM